LHVIQDLSLVSPRTAAGLLVTRLRWRRRAMAAFGLAVGMLLVAVSTLFAAPAPPPATANSQQLN
jgi:hypothetical protein